MSRRDPGMAVATLSALAEPTRMRIAELLREGPMTVGEIADRLGLRQPQASKHLKVLSEGGLLEVKADANRRIYRLRPEPFNALDAWLRPYMRLLDDRLENLDTYLRDLQSKPPPDRKGEPENG
ncbi:MAG: putative transcriptional regulator [Cyanobacteria bacterium RYN_339]|nr:putative transcriptional regulator [Cyanobacteria bacterium RYN_339]